MTRVLFTGASGRMADSIREALEGEFATMRLFSRSEPARRFANEEVVTGDVADFDAVLRACADIDVVVHFAGIADESSWPEILGSNIEGTYHVFEAARQAGVRRVVFASTNHVTGFYRTDETVGVDEPPRPDSYYGVSKVFGESLGRLYHDKWGIEVVSLRIGSFRPAPEDVRQLSIWLSPRDGAELVRRAIVAPDIGYLTVFGVSANTRSFWDNTEPARALGYEPHDDAEQYADTVDRTGREHPFQGGGYADPDYVGGSWVPRSVES